MTKKDKINLGVTGGLFIILILLVINGAKSVNKVKQRREKQLESRVLAPLSDRQSGFSAEAGKKAAQPLLAKPLFEALDEETKNISLSADPFAFIRQQEEANNGAVLSGIISDKDSPKAIINNSIVGIGDIVNGNVVVAINRDKVILHDGEKEIELRLGE